MQSRVWLRPLPLCPQPTDALRLVMQLVWHIPRDGMEERSNGSNGSAGVSHRICSRSFLLYSIKRVQSFGGLMQQEALRCLKFLRLVLPLCPPLLPRLPCYVDFEHRVPEIMSYEVAAVRHAALKAQSMGVPLSIDPGFQAAAQEVMSGGLGGQLLFRSERLLLAPSAGVVEASDTLSEKHDWVQNTEERTPPLHRLVYMPKV
mmetsp:Transcript_40929/g.97271  ORF Transcript_40929/g.97271 Transcript_40929/m.97271 type:complete len:203 (+) Transcript_40929:143-751(+)